MKRFLYCLFVILFCSLPAIANTPEEEEINVKDTGLLRPGGQMFEKTFTGDIPPPAYILPLLLP